MKHKIISILEGRKQECYDAIDYLESIECSADDLWSLERDIEEEENKILFIDNLIYEIMHLES